MSAPLGQRLAEYDARMRQQLYDAATRTAPGCPECDTQGVAIHVERKDEWSEIGTGDRVVWVFEVYQCPNHGRYSRRIELDRVTREEQNRENDNAVARAVLRNDLYRRAGFAALFPRVGRGIERRVQSAYPRRTEPDLLERWRDQHRKP